MALTPLQRLQKFGVSGEPLPVTQLLVLPIKHPASQARSVLFINEKTKTFVAANIYKDPRLGWRLGEQFNPAAVTRPLPAKDDKHWKRWEARGYKPAKTSELDVAVKVAAKPRKKKEANHSPELAGAAN